MERKMTMFPKLKLPLDRRLLDPNQGRQLLAYDIILRLATEVLERKATPLELDTLKNDAEANLHSLGNYIEAELGKDRFDPEPISDGTMFGLKLE